MTILTPTTSKARILAESPLALLAQVERVIASWTRSPARERRAPDLGARQMHDSATNRNGGLR